MKPRKDGLNLRLMIDRFIELAKNIEDGRDWWIFVNNEFCIYFYILYIRIIILLWDFIFSCFRLEQKEEEKSKLGNFYTEKAQKVFSSDTSHDKPELVYFEDLDEKYTAFKPLSIYPVKEKSEPKNVKTVGVKKVKEKVVKSKVKTLDAHDEKVKENESSDLNYFDELAFKDSLEKFSAESANTPRTVQPAIIR